MLTSLVHVRSEEGVQQERLLSCSSWPASSAQQTVCEEQKKRFAVIYPQRTVKQLVGRSTG